MQLDSKAVAAIVGYLAAASKDANSPKECALLGPDYPAPRLLPSDQLMLDAKQTFEDWINNSSLANSNNTAYSVSFFSTLSNETLYEAHYTSPNVKDSPVGVNEVDGDSAYRIGSISKVFTVWNFLINAGDKYFNRPVTDFLPELQNENQSPEGVLYDDIDNTRWEDITLGDLARQSSGLIRDIAQGDLSDSLAGPIPLPEVGLPELPSEEVPKCGTITTAPCQRQEFLQQLLKSAPVFPTSHSPAYSNIAFEILSYALESITKKDFEETMNATIFEPLGMTRSGYKPPMDAGFGVIPGPNTTLSGWNFDLGVDSAGGSVYASTKDLRTAGRAILSSRLLPAAETRRWMRPTSNTADTNAFVGAPWEIRRLQSSNGRVTDYYNKGGDVGAYHSSLVLSPDHQVGFTIMTAVNGAGSQMSFGANPALQLRDALVKSFMPAVEEIAKQQADTDFAGTYSDPESNSTVTVSLDKGQGLLLSNLFSRGKPTIDFIAMSMGIDKLTPRLYPSGLNTVSQANGEGSYASRIGFRAAYAPLIPTDNDFSDTCLNWFAVGAPLYGGKALDDWVFEMNEEGRATSLLARGLRLSLKREA